MADIFVTTEWVSCSVYYQQITTSIKTFMAWQVDKLHCSVLDHSVTLIELCIDITECTH